MLRFGLEIIIDKVVELVDSVELINGYCSGLMGENSYIIFLTS